MRKAIKSKKKATIKSKPTPPKMPKWKLNPYPLMDEPEIEALRTLFEEHKPNRVLEWGAGGSTLYWPILFPSIDWWAIESSERYAKVLKEKIPNNVTLLYLIPPAYYEIQPDMGTFDLVIVDGENILKRVICLDIARDILSEGGIVVLHDGRREHFAAARDYYNSIEVLYPHKATPDPRGLWLLSDPKPVNRSLPDA